MLIETRIVPPHTTYVLDVGSNLIYLGQDGKTHVLLDVLYIYRSTYEEERL